MINYLYEMKVLHSVILVLYSIQSGALGEIPKFRLYTKGQPETQQELIINNVTSLTSSQFKANDPVVFYIFGLSETATSPSVLEVKAAYFANNSVNFIVVDWSFGSLHKGEIAQTHVESVGIVTARMIDFLAENHVPCKSITVVGFGLGAHAAGAAGKFASCKIGVIVGLDPTTKHYDDECYKDERLKSTDATYVQVIYTTSKAEKSKPQQGQGNFYVNYGEDQPGCVTDRCHHQRAWIYYAESVRTGGKYFGQKCPTLKSLRKKECNDYVNGKPMGGYPIDTFAIGMFNVDINESFSCFKG